MVFYVIGDSSSIGMKKKKERMQKGQNRRKGMNVAALVTQCRSIGKKTEIREIGRIANAAALSSECRGIGP